MRIGYTSCEPGQAHEKGRELLATLYKEHTGNPMPRILVTQRGKPYFPEDRLHFSISHTGNQVFCVLSEQPVGIDAERMDRKISLQLAEKILSSTERVRYEKAQDKRAALLRLWVLKEAEAKRSGQGLCGYPNGTDFDPEDPRIQMIEGCYVAILE